MTKVVRTIVFRHLLTGEIPSVGAFFIYEPCGRKIYEYGEERLRRVRDWDSV